MIVVELLQVFVFTFLAVVLLGFSAVHGVLWIVGLVKRATRS